MAKRVELVTSAKLLRRARALLKRLEFAWCEHDRCMCCGSYEEYGHAEGCEWAALLAETDWVEPSDGTAGRVESSCER